MTRREFLGSAALSPVLVARPPQRAEDAGFVSLFDGTSLNGWIVADGPESAFYVDDGAIVVHESAGFPTWLRSARQYENFEFRAEFFVKGWTNSGIYLHAPEHGRNISCGMKINIFQQVDRIPRPESMGSIFPVVAPVRVNVKNNGEWNSLRILMDWPRLQVWTNDEVIQDVDLETIPELRHRLRSGYLGLESLSYPIRFRALRVRELPSKVSWTPLYESAQDLGKWRVLDGKPVFQALGAVLHGDGDGHFGTTETFRDFELQMYLRHVRHHNGGVVFGAPGQGGAAGRRYEIQLHDVEGAHYPTGSLYGVKRSLYPRIEPEQWWLFQLRVQGPSCLVRCNGDTVLEYDGLVTPNEGPIALQAHDAGRWTEYKHILVRRL
jgi:3-keto-disaccharide hydrolase